MGTDTRFQCPACGSPVTEVELRFIQTPSGYGLHLDDCGHTVTLDMLRDAWGIDLPEPDPKRIAYSS